MDISVGFLHSDSFQTEAVGTLNSLLATDCGGQAATLWRAHLVEGTVSSGSPLTVAFKSRAFASVESARTRSDVV